MKQQCLKDVLNSLNINDIQPDCITQHIDFDEKSCDVLASVSKDELTFYLEHDEAFASLYKRYRQAKHTVHQSDPHCADQAAMLDIIEWKLESAEGACLTRLIEMQNDEDIQGRLNAYREEKQNAHEDEVKRRVTRRRQAYRKQRVLSLAQRHQALKDGVKGFVFVSVLLAALQEAIETTHDHLSLAFAFEFAAEPSAINRTYKD